MQVALILGILGADAMLVALLWRLSRWQMRQILRRGIGGRRRR